MKVCVCVSMGVGCVGVRVAFSVLTKLFSLSLSPVFWQEENWLSWLFEKVVVIMVCFFVCSIVNSMAQSCAKRKQQEKRSRGKTE